MADTNSGSSDSAASSHPTTPATSAPDTGIIAIGFRGDGHVGKAVRIRPLVNDQADEGIGYTFTPIPELPASSETQAWQDLPITLALGFPLRVMLMPVDDELPQQVSNPLSTKLFIDPDKHSATFGQPTMTTTHIGDVIVARKDGKELHVAQVSALCHHLYEVEGRLRLYTQQEGGTLSGYSKTSFAGMLLMPHAFSTRFDEIKQAESSRGGTIGPAYATASNPVPARLL